MRPLAGLLLLVSACASKPPPVAAPPPDPITPAPTPAPPPDAPTPQVRAVPPDVFPDHARRSKHIAAIPAIRAAVQRNFTADQLIGLAYGVVVDGELLLADGLGQTGDGKPVDARTAFRIGSITKVFTASAILKFADAGRLDLDGPASAHLPELARLVYPSADARPLTVRDILTHTAGLPRNPDLPGLAVDRFTTRAELMAAIDGLGLARAPGLAYEYSNLGFSLLGHVVAAVSGRPYRDTIRAEVLAPLGMRRTVWQQTDVTGTLAFGHHIKDGVVTLKPPTLHGEIDAAGGLFSTVDDLAKFVAFQLAAWPARSAPDPGPLPRAVLRDSHTLRGHQFLRARGGLARDETKIKVTGSENGTGHVWRVSHGCDGSVLVGHTGATDGYHASIRMLPHAGVGIIVLANAAWADVGQIADVIQAALARDGGLHARDQQALPAVTAAAERVTRLLDNWDDAAFLATSTLAWREEDRARKFGDDMRWLHAALGPCTPGPVKKTASPWSAVYPLTCERGAAELTVTLTTAATPKIAGADLVWLAGTPSPAVQAAATAALPLLTTLDEQPFRQLFSPAVTRTTMDRVVATTRTEFGACRLGPALEVTGPDSATFSLDCDRGPAKLSLALDHGQPARIAAFQVTPVGPTPPCR